jgi:hypothetical protein
MRRGNGGSLKGGGGWVVDIVRLFRLFVSFRCAFWGVGRVVYTQREERKEGIVYIV